VSAKVLKIRRSELILCCGEALIDMIPSVNQAGEPGFTPHPGGAIFNTSIALARLRTQTGFLSGLSSDLFGDQLRAALAGSNVDASYVITSDRPTTLAFVQLTGGHATYTFYDENTAGRQLDPEDLPTLPDTVSALYFGGISLINEPCAEFYTELAVREAASRVIFVDPNIRANFIQDEDTYRARLDRIISYADILKVSDEDLNWIVPGPLALVDKVKTMLAMGPKVVVLTRGGAGASAFTHSGIVVDVASKQVEVVDTVGAGDTFNAGVLAKLSENGLLTKQALQDIQASEIQEALAYGASVAAITVSRSGANPPWGQELDAAS
jgi:fructokinase